MKLGIFTLLAILLCSTSAFAGDRSHAEFALESWGHIEGNSRNSDLAVSGYIKPTLDQATGIYARLGLSVRALGENPAAPFATSDDIPIYTLYHIGLGVDLPLSAVAENFWLVGEYLISIGDVENQTATVNQNISFNQLRFGLSKHIGEIELTYLSEKFGGDDRNSQSDGKTIRAVLLSGLGIEYSDTQRHEIWRLLLRLPF